MAADRGDVGTAVHDLRDRVSSPEGQDLFKRWFDASPIYSGGPVANRLGWQVLRTSTKRTGIVARRRARPPIVAPAYAESLRRDGIVVIPDFLAPDEHLQVRAAFDRYRSSRRVRDIGAENGSGIGFVSGPVVADHPDDDATVLNALLASDPRIAALGQQVIGRSVRGDLRLVLQELELRDGQVDDRDREQILHADKAYPCAKAIYAVDEVTEGSSPFVYCPGTHRLTVERLRYEYAMSVEEARRRRGADVDGDKGIVVERSRTVMGDELRHRLGIEERPITCPANTLVVVDNAGFHRRGALASGHSRRTLWVNFYPYQRPWYGKVAFRAVKSVLDTDHVTRALPAHAR
jgi:hypothetical protein